VSAAEFIRVSNGTYTTAVYLDGFAPPPEDAALITFHREYRGLGGYEAIDTRKYLDGNGEYDRSRHGIGFCPGTG